MCNTETAAAKKVNARSACGARLGPGTFFLSVFRDLLTFFVDDPKEVHVFWGCCIVETSCSIQLT